MAECGQRPDLIRLNRELGRPVVGKSARGGYRGQIGKICFKNIVCFEYLVLQGDKESISHYKFNSDYAFEAVFINTLLVGGGKWL